MMGNVFDIYEHSDKLDRTYGAVYKKVHYKGTDSEWEEFEGEVATLQGLVTVSSYITPCFTTSKYRMTFLRMILNGIDYRKCWKHYKVYTPIGLARLATKFAEECSDKS